jgi:hypothetical protein
MKAEEVYDVLKNVGIELKSVSSLGFESYERAQTIKVEKVTIFETVKCREGIWSNFYAGVLVDVEDGSVIGVYATYYYRDDPWNYSASKTYVAAVKPLKVRLVERYGESVEVRDPPSKWREWREKSYEKEVELPVLPPELAKRIIEEMRNSTYVKYIRLGEKLVEIKWPEL